MSASRFRVIGRVAAVLLARAVSWGLLDVDPETDHALRGWMSCVLDLLLLGADVRRVRRQWLRPHSREALDRNELGAGELEEASPLAPIGTTRSGAGSARHPDPRAPLPPAAGAPGVRLAAGDSFPPGRA